MQIWEAALIVLYETGNDMSRHYSGIAAEILSRGLTTTKSNRFSQTVGTILREYGRGHFSGGTGDGFYRLKDRSYSTAKYERLKESYRWLLPIIDERSTETISPIEMERDRNSQKPPPRTMPRADNERKPRGKRTSRKGVPRKAKSISADLFIADQLIAEEVGTFIEGATKRIWINAYERDQNARLLCIQYHGLRCQVCKVKFEEEFGDVGSGFIHVHHLKPLASTDGLRNVDPINDLRPVCPNCHAMLHKGERLNGRPFSIDELKEIRRRAKRRTSGRRKRAQATS